MCVAGSGKQPGQVVIKTSICMQHTACDLMASAMGMEGCSKPNPHLIEQRVYVKICHAALPARCRSLLRGQCSSRIQTDQRT